MNSILNCVTRRRCMYMIALFWSSAPRPNFFYRRDDTSSCYFALGKCAKYCNFMYNGGNSPKSKTTLMFRPVRQMVATVGRQTTLFDMTRWRHRGRSLPSPTATCSKFIGQCWHCRPLALVANTARRWQTSPPVLPPVPGDVKQRF